MRHGYEADCEDYDCKCTEPVEEGDGYCKCGCDLEDHGAGFRAAEQSSADEGRAVVAELAQAIYQSFTSN